MKMYYDFKFFPEYTIKRINDEKISLFKIRIQK